MSTFFPSRSAVAGSFLLSAAIAAGCAGSPDEESRESREAVAEARLAIQGGYAAGGDSAVVGLTVADEDGYLMRTCSGVLVSPTVVLTAQHCVAVSAEFASCADARFGDPVEPERLRVTTAASMWAPDARWRSVVDVSVSPGLAGVCGRDVALMILADRADDEATPLTPRVAAAVEPWEAYSAVGFGASTGGGDDTGLRRRRDDLTVVCVGPACSTHEVDGREWRGDHGVCNGDSGGPALDLTEQVIGITSRGPDGCDHPIYGGLVAHRDWIVDETLRAADLGGYGAPSWAGGEGVGAEGDGAYGDARWSSCAAGPVPAARPYALLVISGLLLGITALPRVGRRRR